MINSDWKPEFFFAPGFVPSMQPTLLSPAHQLDPMSPPSVAPSQSSQGTSTRCAADPSYSGRGRPGRRRRPAVPDPPDELALQSTFKRKRRPKPTSVAETPSERDCTVCGAPAHGYNFDCLCCESCKSFFRRNAWLKMDCANGGACVISRDTRKNCPACRLVKCFAAGMKREFIFKDSQIGLDRKKTLDRRSRRDSGRHQSAHAAPDDEESVAPSAPPTQLASHWNMSNESLAYSNSAHTSPGTASDSASVREWKERYATAGYEGWTVFDTDDVKPPPPHSLVQYSAAAASSSSWMPVWSSSFRRASGSSEEAENSHELSRQCDPRTMQDSSADLSRYSRVLQVINSADPQFDIRVMSEARCGPIIWTVSASVPRLCDEDYAAELSALQCALAVTLRPMNAREAASLPAHPTNVYEYFAYVESSMRRVIRGFKALPLFRAMPLAHKMRILQTSVSVVLRLSSVYFFDVESACWRHPVEGGEDRLHPLIQPVAANLEAGFVESSAILLQLLQYSAELHAHTGGDRLVRFLLLLVQVLAPHRFVHDADLLSSVVPAHARLLQFLRQYFERARAESFANRPPQMLATLADIASNWAGQLPHIGLPAMENLLRSPASSPADLSFHLCVAALNDVRVEELSLRDYHTRIASSHKFSPLIAEMVLGLVDGTPAAPLSRPSRQSSVASHESA